MFDNRNNNLKKINSMFAAAAAFALLVTGCGLNSTTETKNQPQEENASVAETSVSAEEKTTEMTARMHFGGRESIVFCRKETRKTVRSTLDCELERTGFCK